MKYYTLFFVAGCLSFIVCAIMLITGEKLEWRVFETLTYFGISAILQKLDEMKNDQSQN